MLPRIINLNLNNVDILHNYRIFLEEYRLKYCYDLTDTTNYTHSDRVTVCHIYPYFRTD